MPKIESHNYTAGTAAIYDVLCTHNYEMLIACHNDDPALEEAMVARLLHQRVAAIINVPCTSQGLAPYLTGHHVPVVEYFRRSEWREADAAIANVTSGMSSLTETMIKLGHRRILLASGKDITTMNLRVQGFLEALFKAGIEEEEYSVAMGEFDVGAGIRIGETIFSAPMDEWPTAIVAGSGPLAMGVLQAAKTLGAEVPGQVSVAALANVDWASISNPSLTTYEMPLREMGMLAAQMILSRLEPHLHSADQRSIVQFSGHLKERASTSNPRPISKTRRT